MPHSATRRSRSAHPRTRAAEPTLDGRTARSAAEIHYRLHLLAPCGRQPRPFDGPRVSQNIGPCRRVMRRVEVPHMMKWKKLSCAVDLAEPSRISVECAADLARRLGAELTLVHVHVPLPPGAHVLLASRSHAKAEEAEAKLERWRKEVEGAVGPGSRDRPVWKCRRRDRASCSRGGLRSADRGSAWPRMDPATHHRLRRGAGSPPLSLPRPRGA